LFSSSSVVDGSLPSTAGELHPRLQDSQCHPLILDGFFDSAPDGASSKLCLHVLSSFQRTGYLLASSRALQRVRGQAPRQVNFLQGNLSILQSVLFAVNPFLAAASIFFEALSRASHHANATTHRFRWKCALKVRLGNCELKEVSTGKCRRRVTLGPTNIRCTWQAVNAGTRPNQQLSRTHVTDWLVEL
jgi:hypothetical protein